ncbi:MAG: 2,3-cyclic 3-phosphodiesterase [Actinomycetota bacterium]|nr:2,3-cyclic 3-phosphodiesterase [Actinomycetota bacterium]
MAHLAAALSSRRTSKPEEWHITLAFLGEVSAPEGLYDGLREAVARTPPFELHLAGSGAFTGARAVWTGVAGDVDGLGALASEVQQACRAVGVPLERRRFRPHLTVGKTGRITPAMLSGYEGPPWQVHEVELVHSVLGRTATHTVLERFPLYQA